MNTSNAATAHRIAIEDVSERIRVEFAGTVIADTTSAKRLCEGSLPPVYYLPPDALTSECFQPTSHTTRCPFKGEASYYTVAIGERQAENAAWYYPDPIDAVAEIKDHVAFYPDRVEIASLA